MYRITVACLCDTGVCIQSAAACHEMHHGIAHAQVFKSHHTRATAYVNLQTGIVFSAAFDHLTNLWPAYILSVLTAVRHILYVTPALQCHP